MGPSRPNPLGGWRLRAISLSFVVDDASASLLSSRPHLASPIRIRYRIYGREYLIRQFTLLTKGFQAHTIRTFKCSLTTRQKGSTGQI